MISEEKNQWRRRLAMLLGSTMLTAALIAPACAAGHDGDDFPTATKIKHLVVIFQENVSFDHYFGTYPHATNEDGSRFKAEGDTPSVNGLTDVLLHNNPNLFNPQRLGPAQAFTCDQDHTYFDEQLAVNGGAMNMFVQQTGRNGHGCNPDGSTVMDYFDGNTVTALWNYAQHFAISDNLFGSTFGPSTPGVLNLIAGQTGGAKVVVPSSPAAIGLFGPNIINGTTTNDGTIIGDVQPAFDDCSTRDTAIMTGRNVGDLLNDKGVTWGWFNGGFAPAVPATFDAAGNLLTKAKCTAKDANGNVIGATIGHPGVPNPDAVTEIHVPINDYVPHHSGFQYFASTSNPHHLPPTSTATIGRQGDRGNHVYDLSNFWQAVNSGHMPAVSFLKAKAFQDGHPGNSDPLTEQTFLVDTINKLQQRPDWAETAIIITYDDSDGWYDHAMGQLLNPSAVGKVPNFGKDIDGLSGPGACGGTPQPGAIEGRCGLGPRFPFILISPWAKKNYVDHRLLSTTSVMRFIEDNWRLGRVDGDAVPDQAASFDRVAGTIDNMFDFDGRPDLDPFLLNDRTGRPLHGEEDVSER